MLSYRTHLRAIPVMGLPSWTHTLALTLSCYLCFEPDGVREIESGPADSHWDPLLLLVEPVQVLAGSVISLRVRSDYRQLQPHYTFHASVTHS